MLVAVLGLFSTPALTAEDAAQARASIVVQGNRRVDAETVRSYFHAAPDGRFDAAARDAALKALLATGLFDTVAIDRAG
jgi:outer membrane protein insertion porin family